MLHHTFAQRSKQQSSSVIQKSNPNLAVASGQHQLVKNVLHSPTSSLAIQPKLTIGEPNDKYEEEADRVANQVMRMAVPHSSADDNASAVSSDLHSYGSSQGEGKIQLKQIAPQIQRQEELEEEEEEMLQAKSAESTTPEVTPAINSDIQSLKGGGRPLSGGERCFFEPRFGADFSAVRVHSDMRAANVARSINARAFTLGRDVVFGAGEYSPETSLGRKLLAHELTHVVQQNSAPVSAKQIQRDDDDGVPAQQPPATAAPTLNFGTVGATLTRGDTLIATVNFTANAGETMNVTRWRYITTNHGTVTRPSRQSTFQSSWSGTMAVSGDLEMQYTITPAGGSAGTPQTITQAVVVNDRTGANWQSSVTNAAQGALSGKPSPPTRFSDLGHHSTGTSQPNPAQSRIADGPNRRFTYVASMAAGTYTSTPNIHPDLTATTSAFKTFHSNPSLLFLVAGTTKTRIPNTAYSSLSTSGNTVSFSVPQWETFFKTHNFYRVRATGNNRTVTVQNAWWGLASNAESAGITITNDAALRNALGGSSGSYNGAYSVAATPRGSWEGYILMQAPAILTGTQRHEYVHATHSHRANFTKMVRAVDPRKVLEKKVSAPGHSFNFSRKVRTLISEILRPNHEIVDETASATAENFVAQAGVTMADINEDPATGASLGSVWNISSNRVMTR